jgi:hypothetical protein
VTSTPDRLAEASIGPGATYPMRGFPDGALIHVAVEAIYGTGPLREDQTQT